MSLQLDHKMSNVGFLNTKPSWSKNSIKKISKQIRHNEEFDVERFDQFIAHASELIDNVTPIVVSAAADTNLHELDEGRDLIHQSNELGVYVLSSRLKTRGTTVEKIQRQETDLDRIDDIAGIRIDAAITLTKQLELAKALKKRLDREGADRVTVKRHLEKPNSGYRALHVIGEFPAGRVEIQIRTALQSLWANTYEVLADELGRCIRYGDWKSLESPVEQKRVELLHDLSDVIYGFEKAADHFKYVGRKSIEQKQAEEIEQRHMEIVKKIEGLLGSMRPDIPSH